MGQALGDLLLVACILLWGAQVFAYAWPLQNPLVPPALGAVLLDTLAAKVVGVLAVAVGLLIYGWALRAFGQSWRIGIDRATPGPLVTEEVFSWTRNPIYVSLELCVLGTFLMEGRVILLVLALLIVGMLHAQIRREERFLAAAYGEAYREYCQRVGRYVNWRWRQPTGGAGRSSRAG